MGLPSEMKKAIEALKKGDESKLKKLHEKYGLNTKENYDELKARITKTFNIK